MRRSLLTFVGVFLAAGAAASGFDALEDLYGPGDLAMASGFGGLTVGVNGRGTVSLCRWPSPGYHDQVGYRTTSREEPALGVREDHGLIWGIELDGALRWLNNPEWIITQHYGAATDMVMITEEGRNLAVP